LGRKALWGRRAGRPRQQGFLKNRVVTLFIDEKTDGSDIVEELKSLYKSHLVPIRPNRKSERNPGKYRVRIKPKITKNQKDGV